MSNTTNGNSTVGNIVFHSSNGVKSTINNNNLSGHSLWHGGNTGISATSPSHVLKINQDNTLKVAGDAKIDGKLDVDVIITKLYEENVKLNSVLEAMVLLMLQKGIINNMQEFNDIVKAIDMTNSLSEDNKQG